MPGEAQTSLQHTVTDTRSLSEDCDGTNTCIEYVVYGRDYLWLVFFIARRVSAWNSKQQVSMLDWYAFGVCSFVGSIQTHWNGVVWKGEDLVMQKSGSSCKVKSGLRMMCRRAKSPRKTCCQKEGRDSIASNHFKECIFWTVSRELTIKASKCEGNEHRDKRKIDEQGRIIGMDKEQWLSNKLCSCLDPPRFYSLEWKRLTHSLPRLLRTEPSNDFKLL
jgi:hypothetical protein